MELKNTQAKRLYESIRTQAGDETADEILKQLPLSESPSEKRKQEWACMVCGLLSEKFPKGIVETIRKDCHCKPSPKFVKLNRDLFQKCRGSYEDFIKECNESNQGYTLEKEEDAIILTYPCCYCPFIKKSEAVIPKEWCHCSVGYAEDMFGQVFGKKIKAELLESVITGGKQCRIRMYYQI